MRTLWSTLRASTRRATSSPGVPGVLFVIALLFCLFAILLCLVALLLYLFVLPEQCGVRRRRCMPARATRSATW